MNKGVRYIPFLSDFFDKEKNIALYKGQKNSRILPKRDVKYDSDKPAYQKKCGYVDIQHQRVLVEGKMHNYVQIMHCRAYKGERQAPKVSMILSEEFPLVSEYLKFLLVHYKFCEDDALQRKYVECARQDVVSTIAKIEKKTKKY